MIEKVFPNILKNYKNNKWLSERAILAPKNIDVHEINNIVLTKIRDQAVLYKSVDTVLEPNEAVNYPSEFLNSIDLSGFPPHVLQLKIGVPIILLRNINPPKLCNGTRLAVKKTMSVRLQNDDSGQMFSDQLLAFGNGKLPVVGKPKMLYIRNFYVV